MFPRMEDETASGLILGAGVSHSNLLGVSGLILRCPPLLLTSPTNSQSGIDLGSYNFLPVEQARKSSEDAQAAGYARFEKVRAR